MNEIKETWISKLEAIFRNKELNAKKVFVAKQGNGGNKFYYNNGNRAVFIMADVIFEINRTLFSFQLLSNRKIEYRFSLKNKCFWEYESGKKSKRDVNWTQIWKKTKIYVDKWNGKYNVFCLIAWGVNHKGAGDGIYGLSIDGLESFFNDYDFNNIR